MTEKHIETVKVQGGKQHPTYAGVLNRAHEEGLKRIETEVLQFPMEENRLVCVVRATVETSKGVFQGIGDCSPKNTTAMIVPHLIRMAETRAKGRALRDAVNIGEALQEEMGGPNTTSLSELKEMSEAYPDEVLNEMYREQVTSENDVMERHMSGGQTCQKCKKAQMVKNPKTGKWFCEDKCWLPKN